MISEFMQLEQKEKAEVITEMVIELAKETGLPIEVCIAIVAEYKNYSITTIENYIKMVDEILMYQVAFYNDDVRVYKYQADQEIKTCLKNKLLDIVLANPFEVSSIWIRKTIHEFCVNNWENFKMTR